MTAENAKPDEEEVLLNFSVEPTHDGNTLQRYLKEYPEYSTALVACSIELMVAPTRSDEEVSTSETAVDRAWQRFQSAINAPDGIILTNPFAKLNPSAFRSLAKQLDVTNLLLVRLRDRAIDAATIPRRFVEKLATEIGATADAVMAYLSSPPGMVSNHSFRSIGKPTVTAQISFEQAIETSQLTQAQQETIKALKD